MLFNVEIQLIRFVVLFDVMIEDVFVKEKDSVITLTHNTFDLISNDVFCVVVFFQSSDVSILMNF